MIRFQKLSKESSDSVYNKIFQNNQDIMNYKHNKTNRNVREINLSIPQYQYLQKI